MARLTGPDQSERMFYYTSGSKKGQLFPAGTPVPLYANEAGTLPADVTKVDGSTVPLVGGFPTVYIMSTYEAELFKFPDVEDPVVYTSVGGGPIVALHPRTDDLADVLRTRIIAAEDAVEAETAARLLKADRNLIVPARYRAQPQLTMFETFQATNGWSANVGTWTGDTVNHALGSRCITTTTNGAGLANTYRKLGATAQDLSAKNFAMLVKVDQPTRLSQFQLYLGTGSLAVFEVLTAGNGGNSAAAIVQANVWTWIYFSWADKTSGAGTLNRAVVTDWQVRVQDNSTGAVVFSLNAIATYAKPSLYPNGVVSITFDDCWDSQATLAAPTLDLYGYGANAMVIVEALGDTATGKFSQATLDKLQQYHRWEVGGHAYTYAAHNAGFTTLGASALDDELLNLRDWLRRYGYKGHDLFAYPLGDDNQAVNDNVGKYFTFARQIVRVPSLPMPVDQPLRLRSYSVSSSDLLATVQGKVDAAYTNGTWLVLTFHKLVAGTPSAGTEWANSDFTSLISYINGKGNMPVMTVGAVLDSIRS